MANEQPESVKYTHPKPEIVNGHKIVYPIYRADLAEATVLLMPRESIKNTVCEQTRPEDSVEWVKHWRVKDEIYPSPFWGKGLSETEQEFVPMPEIPAEAIEQINEAMERAYSASGVQQ